MVHVQRVSGLLLVLEQFRASTTEWPSGGQQYESQADGGILLGICCPGGLLKQLTGGRKDGSFCDYECKSLSMEWIWRGHREVLFLVLRKFWSNLKKESKPCSRQCLVWIGNWWPTIGIMFSSGRSTSRISLIWSTCLPLMRQSVKTQWKVSPLLVNEVIKKLPSTRAPGVNKIHPEILKAFQDVKRGSDQLSNLRFWRSNVTFVLFVKQWNRSSHSVAKGITGVLSFSLHVFLKSEEGF